MSDTMQVVYLGSSIETLSTSRFVQAWKSSNRFLQTAGWIFQSSSQNCMSRTQTSYRWWCFKKYSAIRYVRLSTHSIRCGLLDNGTLLETLEPHLIVQETNRLCHERIEREIIKQETLLPFISIYSCHSKSNVPEEMKGFRERAETGLFISPWSNTSMNQPCSSCFNIFLYGIITTILQTWQVWPVPVVLIMTTRQVSPLSLHSSLFFLFRQLQE